MCSVLHPLGVFQQVWRTRAHALTQLHTFTLAHTHTHVYDCFPTLVGVAVFHHGLVNDEDMTYEGTYWGFGFVSEILTGILGLLMALYIMAKNNSMSYRPVESTEDELL